MPPRTSDSVLAPFTSRLGKEPDHIIAAEAGVSRALIIAFRKRLGIPAYEGYKFGQSGNPVSTKKPVEEAPVADKESKSFRGRRSLLDPYADMLGKVPDGEIARLAGVTAENVRTYRSRRGIEAAWQKKAEEAEVVAAPAPKAKPAEAKAPKAEPKVEAKAAKVEAPKAEPKAEAKAPKAEPKAAKAVVAATDDTVGARTAYLINVDVAGTAASYAIVATDFADAAKAAVAQIGRHHPGAAIKAIQRIAELLE